MVFDVFSEMGSDSKNYVCLQDDSIQALVTVKAACACHKFSELVHTEIATFLQFLHDHIAGHGLVVGGRKGHDSA